VCEEAWRFMTQPQRAYRPMASIIGIGIYDYNIHSVFLPELCCCKCQEACARQGACKEARHVLRQLGVDLALNQTLQDQTAARGRAQVQQDGCCLTIDCPLGNFPVDTRVILYTAAP
jgi:hypothetical protein